MDYNFIDDPELKSILEKKSKEEQTANTSQKRTNKKDINLLFFPMFWRLGSRFGDLLTSNSDSR